ncbi:CxxxxCH/CxxCH domain-containing protein [Butyricimonas sp. Marseille-P3923]
MYFPFLFRCCLNVYCHNIGQQRNKNERRTRSVYLSIFIGEVSIRYMC